MTLISATLWDFLRILAKAENIQPESLLPIIPNDIPTKHSTALCISLPKPSTHILSDISNTILTIWPAYLHMALGNLGTIMPLELHVVMPASTYSRYWHASTSLCDFDKGIHTFIAYQGIHNLHRKLTNKALRTTLDIFPSIVPNLKTKATHIIDLLRSSSAAVQSRLGEITASGGKLASEQEQVPQFIIFYYFPKWQIRYTISNYFFSSHSRDPRKKWNAAEHSQSTYPLFSISNLCATLICIISSSPNSVFFQIINMTEEYLCLFPNLATGFGKFYPPHTPMLDADLQLATQLLTCFIEQISHKSDLQNEDENSLILNRYNNRIGVAQASETSYPIVCPFTPSTSRHVKKLPTTPRDSNRWMNRSIKLTWGNIPEAKQESYLSAMLPIINTLPHTGHRANFRLFRHGCDSQLAKEMQFEEPTCLEQFTNIGNIILCMHSPAPSLTNLAYAPQRILFNIHAAGNTIDREYEPYSVPFSIRNSSVSWKNSFDIVQLIGTRFPMLLGAITAPLVGNYYMLGEDNNVHRMNIWYSRAHGKVIEYVLATGKTSLNDDSPLVDQICFEEFSNIQVQFCTQCRKWGDHSAYDQGFATCSVPGYCVYCGQGTSRSLYKQHELECKINSDSVICQTCKSEGKVYNHHPSSLAICPSARPAQRSVLLAIQHRQRTYNNRLIADISSRIRIKGGIPSDILRARRDIWHGALKTDQYLAIMTQVPNMQELTSEWDSLKGINILTYTRTTLTFISDYKLTLIIFNFTLFNYFSYSFTQVLVIPLHRKGSRTPTFQSTPESPSTHRLHCSSCKW